MFNGTAVSLSAGGLRAMISTATDDALTEWSPMRELFDATSFNNRKGAMAFPGDPLAFWRDARDGRWYTALAIDGCGSNGGRLPGEGFACPQGGAEQLWSSPALIGPRAKWELATGLGPSAIFLLANHTAVAGSVGPAQRTEFVTPDLWAPGSMPSAPSKSTGVLMSSVYGDEPCCDKKFGARWSKMAMLSRFVCFPFR